MPRAFSAAEAQHIRAALLAAGRVLLDSSGFRKTTIEALAKRAGISKGSFYVFFANKEALWQELLSTAETQLRNELLAIVDDARLTGQACLRAVLETIFAAVTHHPLLRALADPADMAWLLRALPANTLARAQRDDVQFFGRLYRRLRKRQALGTAVPRRVFVLLPAAALAQAQGRHLIGEEHFDEWVAFEIDAWCARLQAP